MSDVLIVGAGPTGLTLAIELLRRNISVRLIDEKETFSPFSKALALQSRTLELFDKIGLLDSFLEAGLKAHRLHFHWKNQVASFSFQELPTPFPFVLFLSQYETEALLYKRFEQLGGILEWKTKLIDVVNNQAVLLNAGNTQEIDGSPWIVACDGAHSAVRKSLKLPFKGTKFPEHFVLADFVADLGPQFKEPNIFLSPQGFAPIFPFSNPTKYRIIFPLEKEIPADALNKEKILSLMKERNIRTLSIHEMTWISSFQIHRRMIDNMHQGNIFFAGDAAHIHSPVGGQGMNTGIQDAINLAWKLALVIKGDSPKALLDTYQEERHPHARLVLKGTTWMTQLITFAQKWCPFLLWRLLKIISSSHAQVSITKAVSELNINYRHNLREKEPAWKGPQMGDRAPDATVQAGKRLFELLKSTSHALLLFQAHDDFEKAVKDEYGELIHVYVLQGEDVRKKYAAGPETLYLIRPDGYINYRTRFFKPEEVFGMLLQTFKPFSQRKKV